ncbi:MAG: hypothetical protein KBA17_12520 [Aliarcobacter sp.]|nr:hypothetical protein [Aliarcobacter sp.]
MGKIITLIISIIIGYYFIGIAGDNAVEDSKNDKLYFVLKKENLVFKDEVVKFMEEKKIAYEKSLEKDKKKVDEVLNKKKTFIENNLPFDIDKDGNCIINKLIENAIVLEKNDLAKEYQKLQKTQLPECNKKIK